MTNEEIARLLKNVAAAYSIKDDKKYHFQIIAYQKASEIIEQSVNEIKDLHKEKKLDELPGIGKTIKSHLEELLRHGKVNHFEEILNSIPSSVFPLLDVPGFGPKKAYRLVSEFKLKNPETVIYDVEKIAHEGKIAELSGFGEKSQKDIIQQIQEYWLGKSKTSRMALPYANELAKKIITYLLKSKHVYRADALGSLHRKMATVGDIDIAVSSRQPQIILDYFASYPEKERIIEIGDKTSSILVSSGKQVDLMVQSPEAYGSLLQHFTGSKAHNIRLREYALTKGLSLSEYGIKKKGESEEKLIKYKSEEEFYNAIGLDWIPPEMRENNGEIELAIKHKLPKLVKLSEIKGDLHLHSSYPVEPSHDMGKNSMEEMIKEAKSLKYDYLGFSEHNPSISRHNSSQIREIIKKRSNFIEHIKLKYKKFIHIFSMLEVDILPEGNLALNDKEIDLLDAVLVSIHSVLDMNRKKMTDRILKGLSHPKAKILAHPTGRLLNQRPGYELDWEKIFDFCLRNKKALEINAWPQRLDLPDSLVWEAVKRGIKLIINTDSHTVSQMKLMEYGVSVARRGWAKNNDILNTKEYNEIKNWLKGGE